ncbi:hypothetical protein ADICYQ_3124 [Cyclobacterium qasimii M12-11B]|uniref:Uncharacterized protein n=1 Tax=Cyclobacterium qasimii M12-11B TaxID=641524 RepID=S7VER6_9BACT|nr:hypothetical protein ADICYQ_3124 [Cyclobacterium qasimii M12-11B]
MLSATNGIHREKTEDFEIMTIAIPTLQGEAFKPDKMERPFVYQKKGS